VIFCERSIPHKESLLNLCTAETGEVPIKLNASTAQKMPKKSKQDHGVAFWETSWYMAEFTKPEVRNFSICLMRPGRKYPRIHRTQVPLQNIIHQELKGLQIMAGYQTSGSLM